MLLFCLGRFANAQPGLLLDSFSQNIVHVAPQVLKTSGIRQVREYRQAFVDTFLSRVFKIDTGGRTTSTIVYTISGAISFIDSFVYDQLGRRLNDYTIRTVGSNSIYQQVHYNYPTADRIELQIYTNAGNNSYDTSLTLIQLNTQQLPIEERISTSADGVWRTTMFSYTNHGKLEESFSSFPQEPGSNHGYRYQYQQGKTTVYNKLTGKIYMDCAYNAAGQTTGCISYDTEGLRRSVYDLRYNKDGLLEECIEQEYKKDRTAPQTTRRLFYYDR